MKITGRRPRGYTAARRLPELGNATRLEIFRLLVRRALDPGRAGGETARLEEAVAAYRVALEEYTRDRDRVALEWAMTQNNLGNALVSTVPAGARGGYEENGRTTPRTEEIT